MVPLWGIRGFPGGSDSEESACSAGDLGSVPGLRRFPYPLQYFCLGNSMDREAWWARLQFKSDVTGRLTFWGLGSVSLDGECRVFLFLVTLLWGFLIVGSPLAVEHRL